MIDVDENLLRNSMRSRPKDFSVEDRRKAIILLDIAKTQPQLTLEQAIEAIEQAEAKKK